VRSAVGVVGKVAEPPYEFPRSAPYSVRYANIYKVASRLYQPPRPLRGHPALKRRGVKPAKQHLSRPGQPWNMYRPSSQLTS
jgi:hypothetical protein